MTSWLRFSLIGVAGAVVQLVAVTGLANAGVHYLAATALAVEFAILHNYFWHMRWTWRERAGSLLRFHLANGLVSLGANLLVVRGLSEIPGMPVTVANLVAIVTASGLNFTLCSAWVFPTAAPGSRPSAWRG